MPASLRCEDCKVTSEVSLVNDGEALEWQCPACGAHHQQPVHDIRAWKYPGMVEAQQVPGRDDHDPDLHGEWGVITP